jgi:hypothetical protein
MNIYAFLLTLIMSVWMPSRNSSEDNTYYKISYHLLTGYQISKQRAWNLFLSSKNKENCHIALLITAITTFTISEIIKKKFHWPDDISKEKFFIIGGIFTWLTSKGLLDVIRTKPETENIFKEINKRLTKNRDISELNAKNKKI